MSLATTTHTQDDDLAVVVDIDPTRPTCKRRDCRYAPYSRGLCRGHWKPLPKLDADGRARMQNVKFLIDPYRGGESPQMICVRLNTNAHALARWLDRHGQEDLARHFYALDKVDKRSRQELAA